MDLRARAYLDLLLDKDSRPGLDAPGREDGTGPGGGGRGPAGPDSPDRPPAAGPPAGAVPAGFAGRITLTIPLATLLGLAERPGEIPGIGPIDPALARDLANAAAQNPKTTWCVTVTDEQGHAIGHGCARPEPRSHARRRDKPDKPGPPGGLRAQHPVRGWWQNVPVQWRSEVPARPSAQAAPTVEGRPVPRRHLPVDHPVRAPVHHRAHPLPHLSEASAEPGGNPRGSTGGPDGPETSTWLPNELPAE